MIGGDAWRSVICGSRGRELTYSLSVFEESLYGRETWAWGIFRSRVVCLKVCRPKSWSHEVPMILIGRPMIKLSGFSWPGITWSGIWRVGVGTGWVRQRSRQDAFWLLRGPSLFSTLWRNNLLLPKVTPKFYLDIWNNPAPTQCLHLLSPKPSNTAFHVIISFESEFHHDPPAYGELYLTRGDDDCDKWQYCFLPTIQRRLISPGNSFKPYDDDRGLIIREVCGFKRLNRSLSSSG